ncbi:bacterial transcriptional activator domain-containing protein [Micromonospora sp. NBC_01699]|uniref:macro domain-containing protein n=1 Tax=Micromonospora sp. NBC_01699 TaxID=2975984 RepID=UPI002E2F6E7E|nr:macro domain-containing protein [Micromonospora sp. NBC_01699]
MFGRTVVEIDGHTTRLAPITTSVLIRLVLAEGQMVTVDELFRDIWPPSVRPDRRRERISVQKRIVELRKLLDPEHPGESSEILRTDRGHTSAYQLVLDPEQVDVLRYRRIVEQAHGSDPATALGLLHTARELWRGRPLLDAEQYAFAEGPIRRLRLLRASAERALLRAYRDVGQFDRALETGRALLAEDPADEEIAELVAELRRQKQNRPRSLTQRAFPSLRTRIVVLDGDLFAQEDAHLVVGFSDTFDTATNRDVVINSASIQGQLLRRRYGGDRLWLDRDLRSALAQVPKSGSESRATKRRGKLTRYPIGTVAVLNQSGKRIFGLAYSHMGNDLVARSSLADLRESLDRLWEAVHRHGQLGAVAMPLVGSGLARIGPVGREDLLKEIVDSFLTHSRSRMFCPELRIVIPPGEIGKIDVLDVAAHLNSR